MLNRLRATWRDLAANPQLNPTERKVMYASLVVGLLIGLGGAALVIALVGEDRDAGEAVIVFSLVAFLLVLALFGPVVKHWRRRP